MINKDIHKERKDKKKGAFTLIELLIVLSIIGTLVTITAPSLFSMVKAAKESTTKANLHSLRTATFGYYVDNNETWPASLDSTSGFVPKYMKTIPTAVINNSNHPKANVSNMVYSGERINNRGGWIYNPKTGDVQVNCSEKDSQGVKYLAY